MPSFKFKALNSAGAEETSAIEAANENDAVTQLAAKNLTVLELKAVSGDVGTATEAGTEEEESLAVLASKVPMAVVLMFYEQLSFLLTAGIPLHLSIKMSIENIKQDELVSVLRRLLFDLSEGNLLSAGMRRFPKVFPSLHTQIIGIGEKTGTLDKSLLQIVDLTKERMEIEKKAIDASSYPLFLMGVSSTMVIGMIMFVFPQFKDIFESFGSKLPALTQFLMDLSKNIGGNKLMVFGGFAGCIAGIVYFVKAPSLSELRETILLKTPLIREVFIFMFVSQMSKTLSSTLKSGIPLLDSLIIVRRTMPDGARREFIGSLIHAVREGELMSVTMQKVDWIPELVWQLTSVGEKTGNLTVIMDNLFVFYKKKYTEQMDKMMGVMKPALMFGSAAVIGTMAGALFIPLFKMGTNMKRGG